MIKLKSIATILTLTILFSATRTFAQSQMEINQGAGSSYKQAEQELNTIYQQILKGYAADTVFISRLKAAERLWIKFRDAEVEMKYPPNGSYGSAHSMCVSGYMEELTRVRINTLKIWVEGIEEGDMCSGSVKNK